MPPKTKPKRKKPSGNEAAGNQATAANQAAANQAAANQAAAEELDKRILLAFYQQEEQQLATDEQVSMVIRSFKEKAQKAGGGDWRKMMYSAFAAQRGIDPRKHWQQQKDIFEKFIKENFYGIESDILDSVLERMNDKYRINDLIETLSSIKNKDKQSFLKKYDKDLKKYDQDLKNQNVNYLESENSDFIEQIVQLKYGITL